MEAICVEGARVMRTPHVGFLATVLASLSMSPVHAGIGAVRPLFDLSAPAGGPFPSNRFTIPDPSHRTGLRVNLPKPDCGQRPSDCEDLDVVNTLDGFNVQPRLSVPFDGPIDVHSVTSDNVFLIKLDCPRPERGHDRRCVTERIGVDQVVWDTFASTLHIESDELLEQHTSYALIVTDGVKAASGRPIQASEHFRRLRTAVREPYKTALLRALHGARRLGVHEEQIAVASVFTTQSVTALLEKIRDQIKAATPAPMDFQLGPNGSRTVFRLQDVTAISHRQQVGTAPVFIAPVNLTLADLKTSGAVGHIAFGKFLSPDYQAHPDDYIPAIGTRTGTPIVRGMNEIYVNLVLPSGPPPPGGWPVVIAGHAGGGSKEGFTLGVVSRVAATLAQHGLATIAINGVAHGLGPLGTLSVALNGGDSVTFASGGRAIDQNGDGVIEVREGLRAAPPRTLIEEADGLRQTVVDLMQLVRVMEVGIDIDGDTWPDLDPSRVYYVTSSFGGLYGSLLLAIEPRVRAAVLNVTGGPRTLSALSTMSALSPGGNRRIFGLTLASRTPSLFNAPGVAVIDQVSVAVPNAPLFNENLPLRDGTPLIVELADGSSRIIQSPVVNPAPGAIEIQDYFERMEWASQSANPVAYAPYFRKFPLRGVPAKRVIIQFAKGDQTIPNPATTAMLRAGNLADRATFYRHDLAFEENPALGRNPHGFALLPGFGAIAQGAQEQIAVFFESDGELTIHPEPNRFFEVGLVAPLPEGLNFIP
jgi:hypothetical protein